MELSSILGLVTHACNVLNSMLRENYSSFNEVLQSKGACTVQRIGRLEDPFVCQRWVFML